VACELYARDKLIVPKATTTLVETEEAEEEEFDWVLTERVARVTETMMVVKRILVKLVLIIKIEYFFYFFRNVLCEDKSRIE